MISEKKAECKMIGKQLGIFIVLCLPVSWILMGIGYKIPTLVTFSCFVPAIAAVFTCLITKESVLNLKIFPRLQENGNVYMFAILAGVALSVLGNGVMVFFFPKVISISEEATWLRFILTLLYAVAYGTIQFFVLMGEEVGWMGFLFPKLEKLCGTTPAIFFTGFIRAGWHIVMLIQMENFVVNLVTLVISNVLLGSLLVLLTKASGSVIPAAITHALTNVVPGMVMGFFVINEPLYQANFWGIYLVTLIPDVLIAVVCYIVLKYKKMLCNVA